MPRKITANIYMTLDGRADECLYMIKYPGYEFKYEDSDPLIENLWAKRYEDTDTVVFGRRSFKDIFIHFPRIMSIHLFLNIC